MCSSMSRDRRSSGMGANRHSRWPGRWGWACLLAVSSMAAASATDPADALLVFRQLPDKACLPSVKARAKAVEGRDFYRFRNGLQFTPRRPYEGRMQDLAMFAKTTGGTVVFVSCAPRDPVFVFERDGAAWVDRTRDYLPEAARHSRFHPRLHPQYQYQPDDGTITVNDALAPSDFGKSTDGIIGVSHRLRWNGATFDRSPEEVER